jgi:hypothetical protein
MCRRCPRRSRISCPQTRQGTFFQSVAGMPLRYLFWRQAFEQVRGLTPKLAIGRIGVPHSAHSIVSRIRRSSTGSRPVAAAMRSQVGLPRCNGGSARHFRR